MTKLPFDLTQLSMYSNIFGLLREYKLYYEVNFYDVKFIYSEKATKFCEIFTLLLSYVVIYKKEIPCLICTSFELIQIRNFIFSSSIINKNDIQLKFLEN